MGVVYEQNETPLTFSAALKILCSVDQSKTSSQVSRFPKGGEIYVYCFESASAAQDWRCDGYNWLANGIFQAPFPNPVAKKYSFVIRSDKGDGFSRLAYHLIKDPLTVLVQYVGNCEKFVPQVPFTPSKVYELLKDHESTTISFSDQDDLKDLLISSSREQSSNVNDATIQRQNPEVYEYVNFPLKIEAVLQIFRTLDETRALKKPASDPKGGEVYVFKFDSKERAEDWKKDKFLWLHYGRHKVPKSNPVLHKCFFVIKLGKKETSKKFTKLAYISLDDPLTVLVHYLGDSSVFKPWRYREPTVDESILSSDLVYDFAEEPLKFQHVLQIFEMLDESRTLSEPVLYPKGGEMFVYKFSCLSDSKKWRKDGYRWKSYGTNRLPTKDPVAMKYHNQIHLGKRGLSKEFLRIAIHLIDDPLTVIVQYLGDNSVWREGVGAPGVEADGTAEAVASIMQHEEAATSTAVEAVPLRTPRRLHLNIDGEGMLTVKQSVKVYSHKEEKFKVGEIAEMFNNIDKSRISDKTPSNPKGGEIYVYRYDSVDMEQSWKFDGYWWKSDGLIPLPKNSPVFKKSAFAVKTSKLNVSRKFMKYAYHKINDSSTVIVHYFGNHQVVEKGLEENVDENFYQNPSIEDDASKMPNEKVYGTTKVPIKIDILLELFKNIDHSLVVNEAPFRPKENEVFIYKFDSLDECSKWRKDGYRWYASGKIGLPSKEPLVKKYFSLIRTGPKLKTSKEFMKLAYHMIDDPLTVIVQYVGDSSVWKPWRKRDCITEEDQLIAKTLKIEEIEGGSDVEIPDEIAAEPVEEPSASSAPPLPSTPSPLKTVKMTEAFSGLLSPVAPSPAKKPKVQNLGTPTLIFTGVEDSEAHITRVEATGRLHGVEEQHFIDLLLTTLSDSVYRFWYRPVCEPGVVPSSRHSWAEWREYFFVNYPPPLSA